MDSIAGNSRGPRRGGSGDLSDQALSKGTLWFWSAVVSTTLSAAVSLLAHGPQRGDERSLGTFFGIVIGGMWTGLLLPGNLGGTSVMGNLRDTHPGIYGMTGWFIVGALMAILCAGMLAAHRTGSVPAALRVGLRSGLIQRHHLPGCRNEHHDPVPRRHDARSGKHS
jgi:hypothetical protein